MSRALLAASGAILIGIAALAACSGTTSPPNCCVGGQAYDCKNPIEQRTFGGNPNLCARDPKRDPDCD